MRPKINSTIRALAAMYWAHSVRLTMRLSFKQIEKLISTSEDFDGNFSGRLYKNGKGSWPRKDTLLKIEAICPGTQHLPIHPFFQLLSYPDMGIKKIEKIKKSLQSKISPGDNKKLLQQMYALEASHSLDSLTLLLILSREFFLNQDDLYGRCALITHRLLCRLSAFDPFKFIANDVWRIIYSNFLKKPVWEITDKTVLLYRFPDFDLYKWHSKRTLDIVDLIVSNKVYYTDTGSLIFFLYTADYRVSVDFLFTELDRLEPGQLEQPEIIEQYFKRLHALRFFLEDTFRQRFIQSLDKLYKIDSGVNSCTLANRSEALLLQHLPLNT